MSGRRLFHQALADELPAGRRDRAGDESRLLDLLRSQAAGTGWEDDYLRRHTADHAAAADRLDDLLADTDYLLAAEPARLLPHLGAVHTTDGRIAAAVYRQSAHHLTDLSPLRRASQLELCAHRIGHHRFAARIAATAPDRPWHTQWSHGRATPDHHTITSHTGGVSAVAVSALPDGTPVIVSGCFDDGTVRVWRLTDGQPIGQPLTGHTGSVNTVAVSALPDGTPVIVSGGGFDDGTVRVWRLTDGQPIGQPLTGHTGGVTAVAVSALPDGTPVIVSGGYDETVRVWRLTDGIAVAPPLYLPGRAVGVVGHAQGIITAGGQDLAVHRWP